MRENSTPTPSLFTARWIKGGWGENWARCSQSTLTHKSRTLSIQGQEFFQTGEHSDGHTSRL